jgi:hypothetical protein
MLRAVSPRGGPLTGGTAVLVLGERFFPTSDTRCAFGEQIVAATAVNDSLLACSSPACEPPLCVAHAPLHRVRLEVSMNGHDFTSFGLVFTYYDAAALSLATITPSGGPRQGGSKAEQGAERVATPAPFLSSTRLAKVTRDRALRRVSAACGRR